MLFRDSVETYQGDELTRNSSRNTRPQSSQLAQLLWTDPGLKSGIGVRELISTLKKKSAGGVWTAGLSQKILAYEENATTIATDEIKLKTWL